MKYSIITLATGLLCWGQANPARPTLPLSVPPSATPPVTGSVHSVHDSGSVTTNGSNLQNTYNSASCGDALILDAGAEYRANFIFNKQCNAANWIQIVSANLSSIPVVTYATQAQANNQAIPPSPPNAANFAKLTSGNGAGVIVTTSDPGFLAAKYNYFGGLEVTNTVGVNLIVTGTGSLDETLARQLPDHIIFDRMYVHGITASSTQMFPRAFLIEGSNVAVVNSYTQDIYSTSADTQAILLALGPGPYLIHNNFLEGAGETVMSGGTGKTPGYSCTVASSPAPTTSSATVNTCIDAASGSVSTPAIGTCVMFVTSATAPVYVPDDWACITGNSSGALTFPAIYAAPLAGAGNVKWGLVPSDITVTNNVFYKPPSWNPANSNYDGVASGTCTVASSPVPTTTSATLTTCIDAAGNPSTFPSAGYSTVMYVSGSTVFTTLSTANSGTGAVTFPALSGAPSSGVRQALFGFRDVKNFFETKYGVRWLVNGNIMQHVWNGGQGGAFNMNSNDQNGDCPWCVSSDVTFTNNLMQDLYGGIGIIPAQSYSGPAPGPLARVLIQNNLFWPQTGGMLMNIADYIIGGGTPAGERNGTDSLQIIHNTFLGSGTNIHVGGSVGGGIPENYTNLVIKDNITEFDQYRWANQCLTTPDGTACINSTLNTGSTSTISNNAIINSGAINGGQGVADSTLATRYGTLVLSTFYDSTQGSNYGGVPFLNFAAINTDYHNFALTGSGGWINAASDGTNPGVNFVTLDAAFGVAGGATKVSGKVSVDGNGRIP